MANSCKFQKTQYQVSYDSGTTWEDVVPTQFAKGELLEYDSPDCSGIDVNYRWRILEGQYICDGNNKYTKEIREESYNNGITWYTSYPTLYRQGQYVGEDAEFCCEKFVGHYVSNTPETPDIHDCPTQYKWDGYRCVYVDPLKIVKCDGNGVLTSADTKYYTINYTLIGAEIGNGVTTIGEDAFRSCFSLTGITIPNTITSIDNGAFYGCRSITSITIPNSVETIGNSAFTYCSGFTSIDIPSSVTSIGESAFQYCYRLSNIDIPNGVIGKRAFYNCTRLTSCTIGNGVTSIGDSTFFNCYNLTSINIPNSVTSIGAAAFRECLTLTSITIPDSVETIGTNAFKQCQALESVIIGTGVTSIGSEAFGECYSLGSYSGLTILATTPPTAGTRIFGNSNPFPIYVPCESVLTYKKTSGWRTYADRIQGIPPCDEPTGGTKFYATYSGGQTFSAECDSNTTLTSATTLPSGYDYYSMTTCEIGDCITNIADYSLRYCTSLSSITINSITPPIISMYSFPSTGSFKIYVPCEVVQEYKTTWNIYTRYIRGIEPCDPTPTENTKFLAKYDDGTAYIKDCDGNSQLTTGETRPSGYEFNHMTSIELGNCVTSISNRTFDGYQSLSSVTFGSGVTMIGSNAFSRCISISSVTIPNSVTSIGDEAFNSCTRLTSCTIGNSVASIGNNAFEYCRSLTSIDIPNSVTSIGTSAFSGCTSLTSASIGSGVTSIGNFTFENCSGLTSVTIGSSVTSIGNSAFYLCRSLTSIDIPNSVTSIGNSAFNRCSGLTSCTIGSGVTNIGNYAFRYCSSLLSITINATTPPTLDNYDVFSNTNNCPIYVPSSSVNVYKTFDNYWEYYADRIQAIPT